MRTLTTIGIPLAIFALAGGGAAASGLRHADTHGDTDLIPREILFGNPERAQVRISPDGKHISFLAPVDGVLNVWVAPAGDPEDARPITRDSDRGIRNYFWAFNSETVLYLQDRGGDENWRVYAVDLDGGEARDLTPFDNVAARIQQVSDRFPDEILVGVNDRNPQLHDIHRVNVRTGERELVMQNPGFMAITTDDAFLPRFGARYLPDGSIDVLEIDENGVPGDRFTSIPPEDTATTQIAGFDKSGRTMFLIDSRRADTGGLYSINLDDGERQLIFRSDKADVSGALVNPVTYEVEAVSWNYDRVRWEILDERIERDFEALRDVDDGEINVAARTQNDDAWIVAYTQDAGPVRYYHYRRAENGAGSASFLFTSNTRLEDLPLAGMHPVVIPARDGLEMVSYLTLPVWADPDGDGRPAEPQPMVLLVHGGPWARDSWGYNSTHQWLANRGYAVLSVNFRGSTGFGKSFVNAGNHEWGKKMHDDLIDAVEWAVEKGIADEDRVAIMGGSYGGYAALAGLTFTPDVFAAGISIVGPSNLITLLESIPPYWAPAIQLFKTRMGDHTTEEGREALLEVSPLTHVDNIRRPLLIGQGANDPRVVQAESDQIVDAMREKGLPVAYALFPDEGHGFARPENRMAFYAVAEAFLAEHIGGRYEPIGDAFDGSSIQIPEGASEVPGLAEALTGR